eukprot:Skav200362  [mRNA]  locus=scaffold2518:79529:89896:- [translate_table: standard]
MKGSCIRVIQDCKQNLLRCLQDVVDEAVPQRGAFRGGSSFVNGSVVEILSKASLVERIARSKCFEWFSCCIILFNSIFIGWHTQAIASAAIEKANANLEPTMEVNSFVVVMQGIFAGLFVGELCIRWAAEGFKDFWMSNDLGWNLLDLLCCVIGVLDISVEMALRSIRQDEPNPLRGVTVIRVLRIVRIVRVVRVIRIMKFFRELRMMIFSTLNSLQSVVWVFFFLFVLIYMFLGLCLYTFWEAASLPIDLKCGEVSCIFFILYITFAPGLKLRCRTMVRQEDLVKVTEVANCYN